MLNVRAAAASNDDDNDLNPRPLKRQRQRNSPSPSSSSPTKPSTDQSSNPASSPCPESSKPQLQTSHLHPLPPSLLLLSLPTLLLHPPSHKLHLQSISLAQHALRRCLALPTLQPAEECRAWTGLVEVGMMWLDACGDGAGVVMAEVETGLTKALLLSQKHPSLRLYTPHLTLLSARLAQSHQSNHKFAAHTLKRLLASLSRPGTGVGATPPHVLFAAHLGLVHCFWCAAEDEAATVSVSSKGKKGGAGGAVQKCLAALDDMLSAAYSLSPLPLPLLSAVDDVDADAGTNTAGTNVVVLLTLVLRLQVLVRHGMWADVRDALDDAERAFEVYDSVSSSERCVTPTPPSTSTSTRSEPVWHPDVPPTLRIHLLMLGVLFYTYAGDAAGAGERLKVLHGLLDSGVLVGVEGKASVEGEDGVIEIPFPAAPNNTNNTNNNNTPQLPLPLRIQTTPPRTLHALAFLLSAVAKRDALGRAPKKGVFARAGLALREFDVAAVGTAVEMERGMERGTARMKADLLGEVVAISTMRSDFPSAQSTLDELIAHTRTHGLFGAYAARIALLSGQLAHARGEAGRARRCYEVAGWVASGGGGGGGYGHREGEGERDEWVRVAARAGEVWVRVGMVRRRAARRVGEDDIVVEQEDEEEMDELRRLGKEVAEECDGLGGTLMAVGEVLRACVCDEVLGAKQHLRRALDLATRAQDNHLRGLVLALISAHYLHTARDHAMTMLGTCGQLAAGLGAVKKGGGEAGASSSSSSSAPNTTGKDGNGNGNGKAANEMQVGNAPLRLWVGERVVELHRWAGETALAERQERVNEKVREVLGAQYHHWDGM